MLYVTKVELLYMLHIKNNGLVKIKYALCPKSGITTYAVHKEQRVS